MLSFGIFAALARLSAAANFAFTVGSAFPAAIEEKKKERTGRNKYTTEVQKYGA